MSRADVLSKLTIDRDPPTAQLQEVAQKELRESPERIKESIVALRKLVKAESNLHIRDDDEFLIIFLRPTKFYPESAFGLLQRTMQFKIKHADQLKDLLPTTIEHVFKSDIVNVLWHRDQHGRRLFVVNVGGSWDPKKVSADESFKAFYVFHQHAMLEPKTQVAGVVVILDFEGLSMKQVVAITPSYAMRLLEFIQDALPLRLKNVHIVKQPFLFNMVYQIFKPLIKAKLKSRLFFHGSNMKSLQQYISPECLPENYGGKLPKINYGSSDWYPTLLDQENVTKEWNSYGFKN